jgi:hypothetical protein
MLKHASAGILICFDKNLEHDDGYGPVDCAAATQNMLLAAHGCGLGACWIGIYPRVQRIEALHTIFQLPEHVIPFAVISLGYADEQTIATNRVRPERIRMEKWPPFKKMNYEETIKYMFEALPMYQRVGESCLQGRSGKCLRA